MNGESRGFAFVTFAHASCAAGAMANMAGAVLPGVFQDRPLNVAPSTRDQQAQVQPACNPLTPFCRIPAEFVNELFYTLACSKQLKWG